MADDPSTLHPSSPLANLMAPARPGQTPAPCLDVTAYGYGYEQPEDDTPSGLLEYWRVLMRNKGTVVLIACIGLLASTLYTLPQTPVYRASTTVEIQSLNADFMNSRQLNPVNDSSSADYWSGADIKTQLRLLQSASLTQRVGEIGRAHV
jgi:hypothetical protein